MLLTDTNNVLKARQKNEGQRNRRGGTHARLVQEISLPQINQRGR